MNQEYVEFSGTGVVVMICSMCNTSCKHCYIGYDGNFEPDELIRLISQLKQRYNYVGLNGTEPLMKPEYLEAFSMVGGEELMTNGLIIHNNPSIIDEIKSHGIKRVGVSYHFQFHPYISSVPRETIENVIHMLNSAGIEVEINCTVSKMNYRYILQNCDYAFSLGVRRIGFNNLMLTGRARLYCKDYVLNQDERYAFFEQLSEARNKYDKNIFEINRCGSFNRDIYRNCDNFYCDSVTDFVVVTPSLEVFRCIFQTLPKDKIGFVKDGIIYVKKDLFTDRNICTSFRNNNPQ